jgi:hypothetical protein
LEVGEAEKLRGARLVPLGLRKGVEHHALFQLGERVGGGGDVRMRAPSVPI